MVFWCFFKVRLLRDDFGRLVFFVFLTKPVSVIFLLVLLYYYQQLKLSAILHMKSPLLWDQIFYMARFRFVALRSGA